MIIDLTEERHPLLTDGAGHFVTLSVDARENTNLEKLFFKRIDPFTSEHVKLVRAFLPSFSREISKLHGIEHIVVHRAFFAGTDSRTIHINNCLKEFYDLLEQHLQKCVSVEVTQEIRVTSIVHKWGPYGLHMIDEYYKYFLYLVSKELNTDIRINNDISVQSLEKSKFFQEAQKFRGILQDIYPNEDSPYWFYHMQYLYILERELDKQGGGDYVRKADITPWWLMKKAAKRVVQKAKNFAVALYRKLGRQ